jgi:hypothetical protein
MSDTFFQAMGDLAITRRRAQQGLAAWVAAMSSHSWAQSPSDPLDAPLDACITYAFPLFEMARTRFNALQNPANPARGTGNRISHRRGLSDHTNRNVTTPNNDTLYSSSWLDLSQTPVRITVPPIAQRYWSIALMDAFTNNFAMLTSRLEGEQGADVILTGPQWQPRGDAPLPAGVRVIRSPSNDVWALGRWLIRDASEMAAVHAIQDGVRIVPLLDQPVRAQIHAPRPGSQPENFVAVVNEMLARNPVPPQEATLVAGFAALGMDGKSRSPEEAAQAWQSLSPALRERWPQRMALRMQQFRGGMNEGGTVVNGWRYPAPAIGNFGANYALRAAVALGGLAALEPVEAVYLSGETDAQGQVLNGQRAYRLNVGAAGLGAQAFWSLSMYEIMPDGRLFFIDNPIKRYAIGDRSPGLMRQADGSLGIVIQQAMPSNERDRANWLPAPAGDFRLMLRIYVPIAAVREGGAAARAWIPALTRL